MPKRWLSENEARAFLAAATWGHLATVGPDGPYITPLHHVLDGNTLYFHCGLKGRKLTNLQYDSRACYEVSELLGITPGPTACQFSTRYRSVQVFGTAKLVEEPSEKLRALHLLVERFRGERELSPVDPRRVAEATIIALQIERLSGKAQLPD
ncbi:MAG: pyridoxamine 5'-phosphate oxidase family protein [Betaproteobacteria bacterium]